MGEIEEGLYVYEAVVKETGIDPKDRTEEIRVNGNYLLLRDNLRKVVQDHGGEVQGSEV